MNEPIKKCDLCPNVQGDIPFDVLHYQALRKQVEWVAHICPQCADKIARNLPGIVAKLEKSKSG
jgi:hypothetical protein